MLFVLQGNSALHYAVSNGNFDIIKVLIQTGVANVNAQNKGGYTPVMLASLCEINREADKKVLRLLLLNADVNITAAQVIIVSYIGSCLLSLIHMSRLLFTK